MSSNATFKWIGLALLGIAVAAAVAIAASHLVSRQIGLASEPISAGDALAPAASQNGGHDSQGPAHGHRDRTTPTATTTTPEPEPTIPTPTPEPEVTTPKTPTEEPTTPTSPPNGARDDHGGGGHGADD